MAISAAPFALKNLGLDAEQLRQAIASLLPNTGGIVSAGDLAVTQTVTPSLGVLVGIGRAWLAGTNVSNFTGTTYSKQGQYFALNDAPFTVTLATADTVNPRIDLIYIGVQDTVYGGPADQIIISKVTGTPAATPAVPTLPANSIALAQVAVAANATSVTNANITGSNPATISGGVTPKGLLFLGQLTSLVSFSAIKVVYAIPSFTFTAGRHYRIGWQCMLDAAGSNDLVLLDIDTASTADAASATTGLTTLQRTYLVSVSSQQFSATCYAYFTPSTTQTLQVKFVGAPNGSFAINIQAGTIPATFTIEDLGAAF